MGKSVGFPVKIFHETNPLKVDGWENEKASWICRKCFLINLLCEWEFGCLWESVRNMLF